MIELQMAAHYKSFYEVAKKIKNPEARLAFYDALDAYRFDGVEPEGLPLEADIAFTAIKPNVDADRQRKEDGAKGGLAKAAKKRATRLENNSYPPSESNSTPLENNFYPSTNNFCSKDNVNDNVNVNVNGNEKGKDNGGLNPFGSPPQEDFSKQAFEIFKDAGLPCCKGNYLSFLQRDFKLATPYLLGYSSREALEACRNYASIFQKSTTDAFWRKQKVAFDKFCERKIRDFLPGNFVPEKYEKSTREDRRGL